MSQGHGGYKCSIKTDHTYFECAYFDEKTMTYPPMNRIERKLCGSWKGPGFTSPYVVVFFNVFNDLE